MQATHDMKIEEINILSLRLFFIDTAAETNRIIVLKTQNKVIQVAAFSILNSPLPTAKVGSHPEKVDSKPAIRNSPNPIPT